MRFMQTSYKTWNDAIGHYFFSPQHAEQRVFLTVDDDTLWKISQGDDSPLRFTHRDHAVQAFIAAVCYGPVLQSHDVRGVHRLPDHGTLPRLPPTRL